MAEPSTHPCFECNFLNVLTAPVCDHCGADLKGAPLRRDFKTDADIWAVTLWFQIAAVLLLVSTLVDGIDFMNGDWRSSISLGILLFATGYFLAGFYNAARVIGAFVALVVVSILTLLSLTHGLLALTFQGSILVLVPGELFLVWCFSKIVGLLVGRSATTVCSSQYRVLIQPGRKWTLETFESPFFWVPIIPICFYMPIVGVVMDL